MPIARFYLDETRSHPALGGEVDLRGLLEAIDRGSLADMVSVPPSHWPETAT